MTFSFGECLSGAQNWAQSSKFLQKIATNSFIASFFIVAIMMIILLIVFRNVEIEDGLTCTVIKVGLYTYVGTLLIMYLHNYYTVKGGDVSTLGEGPNISGMGENIEINEPKTDILTDLPVSPTITTGNAQIPEIKKEGLPNFY